MAKVFVKDGQKMYPVCGFQRNQHKIMYWYDKAFLADDENPTDKTAEDLEFWEQAASYATSNVYDGLIYMPYKFYQRVKEAIVMYDIRH